MAFDDSTSPATVWVKADTPLTKVGFYSYTTRSYTTGLHTLLTATKYNAAVKLELKHPCEKADATVEAVEDVEYTIGISKAWTYKWKAFVFAPTAPCNDGVTIRFPDAYTGTFERAGKDNALTAKEKLSLQFPISITYDAVTSAPSWNVHTTEDNFRGEYHLTITATYNSIGLTKQ